MGEFLGRCQGLPPGVKSKFEILMGKVQEVDENHKKTEKTLMDHDLSRFASSTNTSPCGSPSMEEEISRLQKEKDELSQRQKAEGSSQLSETRRKRIQELEEKIKSLGK